MISNQPAPIALFVYNRLEHTRTVIEALRQNLLASSSDIFIFADAAKGPEVAQRVAEVGSYVRTVNGFRSTTVVQRSKNLGLAGSIIDGVTHLCERYGRVIVVEDDLVTSKYFLKYMNDGLDFYREESKVISIHGYSYPVDEHLPDTFFLRGADCWGWATWKRAWELFNPDGEALLRELRRRKLEFEFDFDGAYPYTRMLEDQIAGRNSSWAVRWYATAFLQDRLTLYPGRSLVTNIGNDGSGRHSRETAVFDTPLEDRPVTVEAISVTENPDARRAFSRFLSNQRSRPRRMIGQIKRLLVGRPQ